MARGIDQNDVWQAADALLLEGARPTIERVRQKIGRGSPNTVSPFLDTWFAQLGSRLQDPLAFSPAKGAPDPVQQASQHFWETALSLARAEVAAEFTSEYEQLGSERSELTQREAELTSREQALEARAAVQEESVAIATRQIAEANARARELASSLARRDDELSLVRANLSGKQDELDGLRRAHEAEREGWQEERRLLESRVDSTERRAAQEIDRAREDARQAQATLASNSKDWVEKVDQLEERLEAAGRTELELRQRLSKLETQLQATLASLRDAEILLDTVRSDAAARERSLLEKNDHLQSQVAGALTQIQLINAEHGALLKSLVASTPVKPPKSSARRQG